MNLNLILDQWENNVLPQDLCVLKAYKKEIDNCEQRTFETWRTTSNSRTAKMLMNEHIAYAEVSQAIQHNIYQLERQLEFSQFVNNPFTYKSVS